MNSIVSERAIDQLRSTIVYSLDHELYKTAEFTAERLMAQNPSNLDSVHLYGLVMYKAHRYKTSFNLTSKNCNQHIGCAYVFAQSCLKLKKESMGIVALEKTLPLLLINYNDDLNNLSPSYTYDPLARYQPDLVSYYMLLAKLYQATDDVKKSALNYANVLKMNPLMFEAFEELCKMGVKVKVNSIYRTNMIDQIGNGLFKTNINSGNGLIDTDDGFGNTSNNNNNNNNNNYVSNNIRQTPESNSVTNFLVTPRVKQLQIPDAPVRRTSNNGATRSSISYDGGFKLPSVPPSSANDSGHNRRSIRSSTTSITSRLLNYPINTLSGNNGNNVAGNTNSLGVITPSSNSAGAGNSASIASGLVTPYKRESNKRGISSTYSAGRSNDDGIPQGVVNNTKGSGSNLDMNRRQEKLLSDPHLLSIYSKLAKSFKCLCLYDCFKAIRILDSLPESERNTPWVLGKLGRLHFEIVNYEESENYFKKLRVLDRTRLEDMEVYSTLLWHLHKEIELSFLSHELFEINDKTSSETWVSIGNLFSLKREPDEAIKCFQKSVEINDKFAYGYTLQGHEYLSNDAFENAIECFRTAILIDNRHYNAYYGIGMCYLKLGDFKKSEFHFRKANEINQVNVILICCIGMILEKLGKRDEALKKYVFATKLQPLSTLALFKKAQSLFSIQEYELALKDFEKLKDLAPDEASIHYLLGKLYKFKGEKLLAIRHFTIALNLDPKGSHLIKDALLSLEEES